MRNSSLLLAILAALPACDTTVEGTACLDVPDGQTSCPARSELEPSQLSYVSECGDFEITKVTGEGTFQETHGPLADGGCCYPVEAIDHDPDNHCVFGRPYVDGAR